MAQILAVDYTVDPGAVAGTAGLALSKFSFTENLHWLFPGWSTIRLACALNGFYRMQADGDVPDIRTFDEQGDFSGMSTNIGKIKEGEFMDIIVPRIDYTEDLPTYALFSGNSDAMCVPYVQQTWAVNGPEIHTFAWVGNWGRTCGKDWYHSGILMDGKALECTWIDGDGDFFTTGIQIHWPDFVDKGDGNNRDAEYLCNHTPSLGFRTEHDPDVGVFYTPPRRRRAQPAPAPAINNDRLIKSNLTIHDASSLCESSTSRGPDFVSLAEGRFCDMQTKTLWPICAGAQDEDCFDNDAHHVRLGGSVGKRDEGVAWMKNYTMVTHW